MNSSTSFNINTKIAVHNAYPHQRPMKRLKASTVAEDIETSTADGIKFFSSGKYREAENQFSRALSFCERNDDSSFSWRTQKSRSLNKMRHSKHLEGESYPSCTSRRDNPYDEGLHAFESPLPLNELNTADNKISTLHYNIGQSLLKRHCFEQALRHFEAGFDLKTTKNSSFLHFYLLHGLGYAHYKCGNLQLSLDQFEKALRALPITPTFSRLVAATMNCIGVLCFHCPGKSSDYSLQQLQGSLEIYRKHEEDSRKEIATVLNNIGRVYFMRSNFEKASKFYVDALQLRKEVLSEDALDIAATCYNAGQAFHHIKNFKKALGYYKNYLQIARRSVGDRAKESSVVFKCMAEIYREQRDFEAALKSYEHSLALTKLAVGPVHQEVASALNKLGNVCYEMGKFDNALEYYTEGLQIERKVLAPSHPHVIITLTNIAHVHKHGRNHADALKFYQHVFSLQSKSASCTSLETAGTLSSMGLMQYHLQDYDGAFESYQEALRLRRMHYQCDTNAEIASTLNSLGLVLFKKEIHSLAKDCFFEALEIRRTLLGSDHHDVAILWYNIATIYIETGEDDMAIKFYKEALRSERASLGDDHPDVVLTLQHLGQVLQQLGFLNEAVGYFYEALEIEQSRAKKNALSEARILNQIGNVHLQSAHVGPMMDAFCKASRILGDGQERLLISGHNYYSLSRMHPACAATA